MYKSVISGAILFQLLVSCGPQKENKENKKGKLASQKIQQMNNLQQSIFDTYGVNILANQEERKIAIQATNISGLVYETCSSIKLDIESYLTLGSEVLTLAESNKVTITNEAEFNDAINTVSSLNKSIVCDTNFTQDIQNLSVDANQKFSKILDTFLEKTEVTIEQGTDSVLIKRSFFSMDPIENERYDLRLKIALSKFVSEVKELKYSNYNLDIISTLKAAESFLYDLDVMINLRKNIRSSYELQEKASKATIETPRVDLLRLRFDLLNSLALLSADKDYVSLNGDIAVLNKAIKDLETVKEKIEELLTQE